MTLTLVLLPFLMGRTSCFCIWGCEEQESSSEAKSNLDLTVSGDSNVVEVMDRFRQSHDDHMSVVKIGVFSILGMLLAGVVLVLAYYIRKRCREVQREEVEKKALAMVKRLRDGQKTQVPGTQA